jgi:hypothetical protein
VTELDIAMAAARNANLSNTRNIVFIGKKKTQRLVEDENGAKGGDVDRTIHLVFMMRSR